MKRLPKFAPAVVTVWLAFFCAFGLGACGGESKTPAASDGDRTEAESELPTYCEDDALGCSGETKVIVCRDGAWVTDRYCEDGKRCQAGLCVVVPVDGDTEAEAESLPEGEIEDLLPPQLSSTSPAEGATDVAVNVAYLDFIFNEPIDITGFRTVHDFSLKGGCGLHPMITGPELINGKRQLRFTIGKLEAGTSYIITLSDDSIKDLAGNVFLGATLTFKTAGEAPADTDCEDDTAPAILSSTPPNGRTGVSLDLGQLLVTFTEPVVAAAYDPAAKVTLSGADGHRVAFVASWPYADNHALLLSFTQDSRPLHPETLYTLALGAGLSDPAGNAAGALGLSFKTEALPDGDLDAEGELAEAERENEGELTIPDSVSLDTALRGSCLVDQSQYQPAAYPESLVPTFKDGVLTLVHHNAPYIHCSNKFAASLTQHGATLTIRETAQLGTACGADDGLCPFDVTYTLGGFVAARYDIEVYTQGAAAPQKLSFSATARR